MPFGQEGKTAAVLAFENGDEDAYMCLSLLIAARVNLDGVDLHHKSDVSCGGIVPKQKCAVVVVVVVVVVDDDDDDDDDEVAVVVVIVVVRVV